MKAEIRKAQSLADFMQGSLKHTFSVGIMFEVPCECCIFYKKPQNTKIWMNFTCFAGIERLCSDVSICNQWHWLYFTMIFEMLRKY